MPLPIDTVIPDVLHALRESRAAVLQAPPGAGKTTRVPLALLDEPWLAGRRIIMLEPRRLAARSAARFMAALLDEEPGQRVGYRTRMDSRVGPETRIEVVTEGILTRILQDDPALEAYGAVLFDEFHERSLQADLGLALTLESWQALREDLRLLVMSATLDAEPVARLLGDVPLITSEGRAHPVEVRYVPAGRLSSTNPPLEKQLAAVVHQALTEQQGSILVFLPGGGEIRRLQQLLEEELPADTFVAPLYGELSREAQDAAIRPAPTGRRKIVLATSIAETSLTIEGVRIVIDSGLHRVPRFDPVTGLSRLRTEWISQASAEQRKGRAGRLEPGVCYRLWSAPEQDRLAPFNAPEILGSDLCDLVLELAQWGVRDPGQLAWLDPPPRAAWDQARLLLRSLGGLDTEDRITGHGRELLRLGLHPRLAHMLVRAKSLGWARLGAELAALLSERDVLVGPRLSDVQDRILALRGESSAQAADTARLRRVRQVARQLQQRLGRSDERPETREAAGILLAYAYPDRIAKHRGGQEARYLLANGRGASLRNEDPLAQAPFIVAAELDDQGREARVFLAAELSRAAIEEHFAAEINERNQVVWDHKSELVRAQRQRCYGALVLDEQPATPDPEAILEALMQALAARRLQDLPWDRDSRQWQARVLFLRRFEGENWPDVSDAGLIQTLAQWLAPFAQGYNRLAQFRNFPLQRALNSLLDYEQQRQLENKAPARLEVPSGSRIALDYASAETPILAVRLQELFGLKETPAILDGRVPLTLHLLSPAQRPVQVTRDLAGFWRQGYAEVRKDLRGRYPKHPWPEDPLTAVATRHAKRRQDRQN